MANHKARSIITEIKKRRLPVIINGAGVVGRVLLSICKDEGIPVECFSDNSKKAAQSKFCDMEVIHTPDLKAKYKDAIFIISVAAIKDAVDRLHEMGYSNWYAGGPLLKDLDISQSHADAAIDYTKFAIENCIICHDGYLNRRKLFLRSIDIIITERCSMKCRDCSNLMQYYARPKDCDTEMLLKSIDVFCAIVDEVMDFRVIGGDAFMNKEWPVIVERLTNEPKAKRVVLYTNGTIVPKEKDIEYLNNDKVIVIMTNYGILSKKITELKEVLKKNKVAYHELNVTEWLDCAAITPHGRGIDGNREIFKICCAKNMATLSDGKLFRCPYGANANRLSAVPDNKTDYVDLLREFSGGTSVSAIKDSVRNYLLHRDYLETCDYCNGRPLSGNEVEVAAQTDKPLEYRKFNSSISGPHLKKGDDYHGS